MGKAGAHAAGGMRARFVLQGAHANVVFVLAGNKVPTAVHIDIQFNCYNFRLHCCNADTEMNCLLNSLLGG